MRLIMRTKHKIPYLFHTYARKSVPEPLICFFQILRFERIFRLSISSFDADLRSLLTNWLREGKEIYLLDTLLPCALYFDLLYNAMFPYSYFVSTRHILYH